MKNERGLVNIITIIVIVIVILLALGLMGVAILLKNDNNMINNDKMQELKDFNITVISYLNLMPGANSSKEA